MKQKINEIIELRKNNRPEEALHKLKSLLEIFPGDPNVNYQIAWTYDFMGMESEAVFYYENAIASGLTEDRIGALLGLGSTYRCLGEYEKSLKIFDQAIDEFPAERVLKVFRALTLFNLGKSEESLEQLLIQLLDTTEDNSIKSYDKALRFYSNKIGETFK